MQVANFIEEARLGGPQTRMANVAQALDGGQVSTTILMPQTDSEMFRARCDQLGLQYQLLPIQRLTRDWRALAKYIFCLPFEIWRLRAFIKHAGFDLIHVSGGSWQYKGVIAGWLANTKVIWHLNDTSMPAVIRGLFRFLSPLADGFVFASVRSREYYRPLIKVKRKEFVIPAPVDVRALDPAADYLGGSDLAGKWEGRFVVGTVANVTPVKGLETFVRMAAQLNAGGVDVQFVIVGAIHANQQNYYAGLKALCEGLGVVNLEFVGAQQDVRSWLQRFDVYVCSSNAESSPIAVWEAMAMAKPVASTNVGDVPVYLHNGENGFVVEVADADALAEAVRCLLKDESMRKRFGDLARQAVIEELDIEHCARRHLECYRSVLSHK